MRSLKYEKIRWLWCDNYYDGPLTGVVVLPDGIVGYAEVRPFDDPNTRIFDVFRMTQEQLVNAYFKHLEFEKHKAKGTLDEFFNKLPKNHNPYELADAVKKNEHLAVVTGDLWYGPEYYEEDENGTAN